MFESINTRSSVAVYVQIENQVQFAVASGQLKAGDRLPSVREFAEKVGVNLNTVAKAYRDLEVMGIVWARRGMGVFINKGVEAKCRERCRSQIIERIFEVVAEAKAAGLSEADVKNVLAKSYASDVGLYGPVPDGILAVGKAKKQGK